MEEDPLEEIGGTISPTSGIEDLTMALGMIDLEDLKAEEEKKAIRLRMLTAFLESNTLPNVI
jgi:hypothetical protein